MKLRVYFSEFLPADQCWMSELRDGWQVFNIWRPTYPEVIELALEEMAAKAAYRDKARAAAAAVDARMQRTP